MDYIVFGIGVGATLVLIGWVFREYGAAFKDRAARREDAPVRTAEELVGHMAWQRFSRAIGTIVAGCGVLLIVVTAGIAVTRPSDSLASIVVGATFVLIMIGVGLWVGFFINRFGTHGILRPRVARPVPVEEPAPAAQASIRSADPVVDEPEAPRPVYGPALPRPAGPAGQAISNPEPAVSAASPEPVPRTIDAGETIPVGNDAPEPAPEGDGADALAAIAASPSPSTTRSLDDLLSLPPDQRLPADDPEPETETETDPGPETSSAALEEGPDAPGDVPEPSHPVVDDSGTGSAPEPGSREHALANLRRRRMQRQGSTATDQNDHNE